MRVKVIHSSFESRRLMLSCAQIMLAWVSVNKSNNTTWGLWTLHLRTIMTWSEVSSERDSTVFVNLLNNWMNLAHTKWLGGREDVVNRNDFFFLMTISLRHLSGREWRPKMKMPANWTLIDFYIRNEITFPSSGSQDSSLVSAQERSRLCVERFMELQTIFTATQ